MQRQIKKIKYEINIYEQDGDKNYQLCYGWDKITDITDLWTCIGWYMNISSNVVSINYLEYYNEIFDTIDRYIKRVIDNNNGVVLRANNSKIIFKIEEDKR